VHGLGSSAFPVIEPTTIRNHPERFLATTAWALARGRPLGRPMTLHERLVVAVIAAHPTHTLTLHSRDASRSDMTALFRRLVKRINRGVAKRSPRRPVPLIYVATVARAEGGDGFHAHALLWQRLSTPRRSSATAAISGSGGPFYGICRRQSLGTSTTGNRSRMS
jgi:hypothetical protein